MKVELKRMKKHELLYAWTMQKEGFKDTLEKYQDYDSSPATESIKRFSRHFFSPRIDSWWVLADGKRAGALEIVRNPDFISLSRFYILPQYRNKGIGQQAVILAESNYPDSNEWRLDTIFEEKNNIHLYEKLGYTEYGERKIVNNRMTLISYKKE